MIESEEVVWGKPALLFSDEEESNEEDGAEKLKKERKKYTLVYSGMIFFDTVMVTFRIVYALVFENR